MRGSDFEMLVRSLGDAPVDLDDLHRRTGGNPLFCREILGLLRVDPTAGIPAGIRALIADRVDRLTPPTRAVLDAAGVLGGPFDVAVLGTVAGVSRDSVAAALDEAHAAGLVSSAPGTRRADFVHALVGEAISEGLPTTRRVELHRSAAHAIEALGDADRVNEIAHHALASASPEDIEWAVARGAGAAAHGMAVMAYEEAACWCERALEALRLEGPDERAEADLLLTLGEARLASGDVDGARAAYERVAGIARRHDDAVLLARAALGLGLGFGAIEVKILDPVQVELLQEALAALGAEPTPWRVWVLARLSVALSLMGREDERVALSDEAVETARRVDDPAALGHALVARCDATAGPDHCERRARDAAEIVQIAIASGDLKLEALGRRHRVVALMELGRVAEADVEIRGFATIADRLRQPRYQWYVPLWQGMRALMRGDTDAAGRLYEEAEALANRAGSPAGWLHTYTLWWTIQRATGGWQEAGRTMTELLGKAANSPIVLTDRWAVAAAMSGDLDRAGALLEEWLHSGLDERVRDSEWLPEAAQVAEAAIVVGNRELARALFDRLRPYDHLVCVEGIGAAVTGSVAWYLAMMAAFLGLDDLATRYGELAAEVHARIGLVGDPPPLTDTPMQLGAPPAGPTADVGAARAEGPRLVHEGATWAVVFGGRTVRVRDSKGMRDLAVLLAQPDREVHSIELMGGTDVGGAPGPVVDAAARRQYELRIRSLQEDIDEAHQANDPVRAERAEAELDALVDQLSQAFGIGGRDRSAGAAAERARSAVTWRIRAAIRAVTAVDRDAGAHLSASVRTGTWCAYRPDSPVPWQIDGP
jgi:tetratricopeptide (TPR) repeat protein